MTATSKSTLIKVAKYVGAGVIAGAVTLLASPDVLNLIPTAYTFVIPVVVVPLLVEVDQKFFGKTPVVPVTPTPTPPAQS